MLLRGGSTLPVKGDSVWVPTGQTLVLDVSPPSMYMIIVQGSLIFDRTDIELRASCILVMGGTLQIGTEREPFLQRAQITLYGSPASNEIPLYGSKVRLRLRVLAPPECSMSVRVPGRCHFKVISCSLQLARCG